MIPLAPAPTTSTQPRAAPEVPIACRRCGHAITHPSAREARDGAHLHTRINPGGWVHAFACFATAPGARARGPATTEHTWFLGHAWELAECQACGAHLGWRFTGAGEFWGLILAELRGA